MTAEPTGFGAFLRRYTKTWMHAVATAGLTAFGMLTFVHRGFVVLALVCYVVPPIVLYVTRERRGGTDSPSPTDAALADGDDEAERRSTDEGTASVDDGAEPKRANAEPTAETERGESATEPASLVERTAESNPDADTEPGSAAIAAGDEDETETEPRWRTVDGPTDTALYTVAVAGSAAIAAGDEGTVLKRDPNGGWELALEDGPAAQAQPLRSVGATDDGAIAWLAGDGGAVGRLEVDSGRHADYSAPNGRTDNLAGVAVGGSEDDETILVINGSGEMLRGRYRNGDLAWSEPVEPGSGSSLSGVVLVDEAVGYCCDTNDGVFATDDGGRTFETVGLENADGTPTDITASGDERCLVCTDAGVVHRLDGSTWTPERVCEDALSGIGRDGDRVVACAASGDVYERPLSATDWERAEIGSTAGLEGVSVSDDLAVGVGADGAVIEWC
jgi:hypothetical protein